MLTVQPYLRTRRPSPTTVEYTVSTSPPLSLPLRLVIALTLLIRLIVGLSVLLLLYSKYLQSSFSTPLPIYDETPPLFSNAYVTSTLTHLLNGSLGTLSLYMTSHIPIAILLPLSLLTLYIIFLRRHTTESLLILRGLGIQTSTSSETYLSTATTRFIPTDRIQDIFVNEAFRGFEVRYLLVLVVEGEKDVVVVFPRLLPGRRVVETVWRGARSCLGQGGGGGGEEGKERWERKGNTGFGVGRG